MAAAQAAGIKKIDYLVSTHYHGDHMLAAVINNTFFGDGQAKGGLGETVSQPSGHSPVHAFR